VANAPSAENLLPPATVADLVRCLETVPVDPLPALRGGVPAVEGRRLSERVRLVRNALLADLPAEYPAFAAVVGACLAQPAFTGWMLWPVTEAVAVRALAPDVDHFDDGLALLAALTPRLTAEFAIRHFLDADPDRALHIVRTWTAHPDVHVRRLASEGTRPRLPWAKRVRALSDRPEATLPILDALSQDPSELVRRSVANHLNDISHTHPALALATAERWLAQPDSNTARTVRHALRTLIKRADPDALALLGFTPPTDLVVTGPELGTTTVPIGAALPFTFTLHNRGPRPVTLAIDYVVHYRKANATLAPKVFKLTTRILQPHAVETITRAHPFRPVSTRALRPGEHALELQINGVRHGRTAFHLTVPPGDR
jgi:3-methyladenine DNA glycosylase AlkC